MIDLIHYACSGFWRFLAVIIIIATILTITLGGIISIWSRLMRCIMVFKNGWPPAHLDADGDFIEK